MGDSSAASDFPSEVAAEPHLEGTSPAVAAASGSDEAKQGDVQAPQAAATNPFNELFELELKQVRDRLRGMDMEAMIQVHGPLRALCSALLHCSDAGCGSCVRLV